MNGRRFFPILLWLAAAAFPASAGERNRVDLQFAAGTAFAMQGARSDTDTSGFQAGGRFDLTAGALFADSAAIHFGLRGEVLSPSAFDGDRNLKGYASVGPQFAFFYRGKAAVTESLTVMPGFQAGASLLQGKYSLIENRFFYPTFDAAVFCDLRPTGLPLTSVRIFIPFSAAFRRDVPVCLGSGIGIAVLFDHFLPSTRF